MRQSSPISTPAAITCWRRVEQRRPSRAPASITTLGPISQSFGTTASARPAPRVPGPRRSAAPGKTPAPPARKPYRVRRSTAAPFRVVLLGGGFVDKRSAGARAAEGRQIFPVFEKAQHRPDRRFRAVPHHGKAGRRRGRATAERRSPAPARLGSEGRRARKSEGRPSARAGRAPCFFLALPVAALAVGVGRRRLRGRGARSRHRLRRGKVDGQNRQFFIELLHDLVGHIKRLVEQHQVGTLQRPNSPAAAWRGRR